MSTRKWDKKAVEQLHDYYIRGTLAQQYGCKRKDVPQDAVHLKRLLITYTRKKYNELDLIMQSKLIGKTVDVYNKQTGQTITGKVISAKNEGGILLVNISGQWFPPEYIQKISE